MVWAADLPSLGAWATARMKDSWGSLPRHLHQNFQQAASNPQPSPTPKKSHRVHLGYGFQTTHGRRNQKGSATAWGHTASARVCSPVSGTPILFYLAHESHGEGGREGPFGTSHDSCSLPQLGNLWEQLKDDSLALDPLVLVTSSPTSSPMPPAPPPPHCFHPGTCLAETGNGSGNLAPPSSGASGALGDLHLTTLYSAFMELEPTPPTAPAGPSVYLSPSSKPMALA